MQHMRTKVPTATEVKVPTLHGEDETNLAPSCPGARGGVGRHYPTPELARWTRLAQTREVGAHTSGRDMVRARRIKLIRRRMRWAGSHASSRTRVRGSGKGTRAFRLLTVKLLQDRGRRGRQQTRQATRARRSARYPWVQ